VADGCAGLHESAGKTTALRVLAGLERADSGRVLVDGGDIGGVRAQRRDMGMVFQSDSLFPNMNALDNVAFGRRSHSAGGPPEQGGRGARLGLGG
jgi:putative spermidine/putrescine transport system ATP-binding protein